MWTQLEAFQRLDSRLRGNDKQGGNDEGDAFPWSPYPKLGLPTLFTTEILQVRLAIGRDLEPSEFFKWIQESASPMFYSELP